jgi:Fe-S cluster assembly protein SufD
VFNGKAIVHEGAQQSQARQTNRNLLLTAGAEIDTKPELEIYADDVQCSHGATTGQLDAAALFYLRSRGLSELEARSALTRAFAGAVLARMDHAAFASAVHDSLDARLERLLEAQP